MTLPINHESYMSFEVVEADNGLILRIAIPDRGDLSKLIVWSVPCENELEAFAQFLDELQRHFAPQSKNRQIYVEVGPSKEAMH